VLLAIRTNPWQARGPETGDCSPTPGPGLASGTSRAGSYLCICYVCGLATAVTAGTPAKTVVTPVPVVVALLERVSVPVPAPDTTVVPEGKLALVIPTLPPPTRPPVPTMSGGKVPDASVIWFDPLVVLTGRLAAHELFGAEIASAGVAMAGATLSSVSLGNPKVVEIRVPSSASKFSPVELSNPFEKLVLESQIQFRNPPVEARIPEKDAMIGEPTRTEGSPGNQLGQLIAPATDDL